MTGCAEHFDVIRLWEPDDPDAVLDARGGAVRAIATSGHRRVDGALMDRLPKLELVANLGVGYDTIDAEEAARRGVVVTHGAGSLDDDVADTAMGLLLMTVREMSAASASSAPGAGTDRRVPAHSDDNDRSSAWDPRRVCTACRRVAGS